MNHPRPRRLATIIASAVAMLAFASAASAAVNPQVTSNNSQTCVVLNSGSINCWGNNSSGQLGNGTYDNSLAPVAVSGITNATAITSGDSSTCALLADATVRCWGTNGDLDLGVPDISNSNVPVQPTGLTNVVQISGSDYGYCALIAGGTVKCWGANSSDQFNQGSSDDVGTPATVPGLENVVKVQSAPDNVCALIADGSVKCSGTNSDGEIGTGSTSGNLPPTQVSAVSSAVDIAAGNEFACALISDGTVKCWGENDDNELGNNLPDVEEDATPKAVTGLTGAVAIASTYSSTCALIADRSLRCWGANYSGQLGDGTTVERYVPVAPIGVGSVQSLFTVGEDTACVIVTGGELVCWGANYNGQMGDANTDNVPTPRVLPGINVNVVPYAAAQSTFAPVGRAKVDRKKRFYTAAFTATASPSPFVAPAAACAGPVVQKLTYRYPSTKTVKKKGKKVKKKVTKTKVITKNLAWAVNGATCSATAVFTKLPVKYLNKKNVKVTSTFAGNAAMEPTAGALTYKMPKVTIKKKKAKKKK